jgi:hypothetical protein
MEAILTNISWIVFQKSVPSIESLFLRLLTSFKGIRIWISPAFTQLQEVSYTINSLCSLGQLIKSFIDIYSPKMNSIQSQSRLINTKNKHKHLSNNKCHKLLTKYPLKMISWENLRKKILTLIHRKIRKRNSREPELLKKPKKCHLEKHLKLIIFRQVIRLQ